MKKVLLTLLLLLSLGFAASAESVKLQLAAGTLFKSDGGTLTQDGVTWTVKKTGGSGAIQNTWNSQNYSGQQFGSGSSAWSGTFSTTDIKGTVTAVNVIANTGGAAKVSVTVGGQAFGGDAQTVTKKSDQKPLTYSFTGSAEAGEISVLLNGTSKAAYLNSIEVVYTVAGGTEKITLDAANFVVKAGEIELVDEGEYELAAGTEISWSYTTDNANADIVYSYNADAEDVEANTFVFDGTDAVVTFKATSENTVEKTVMLTKKYPTECTVVPVFNVADNAEVYVGSEITVAAEGADGIEFKLGDTVLDGTSYTVAGEIGDVLTLTARAYVLGEADAKFYGKDATLTVTIAERKEVTFHIADESNTTFSSWPHSAITNDNRDESVTKGVVTIHATGRITINNNKDLRLYREVGGSGIGAMEISVKNGYYITEITITGTKLGNMGCSNATSETFTNTDSGINSKKYSNVNGSKTEPACIETITVKYAKCPTEVLGLTYKLIGQKQAIRLDYKLHVKHHHAGEEYQIGVKVDGGEEVRYDLDEPIAIEYGEVPANAPMREIVNGNEGTTEGTTHVSEGTHKIVVNEETAGNHKVKMAVYHNGEVAFDIEEKDKNTTTGIEDVAVDGEQAAPEYYTLQGVRVAQPQAGQIYIVRRGAKATKELVK